MSVSWVYLHFQAGTPLTCVFKALELFVGLSRPVVFLTVVLSPMLFQPLSLRPLALLCCAVREVTFPKNTFFQKHKQQSPDHSPGSSQSDRCTSVIESLWEDESYTGELMLC